MYDLLEQLPPLAAVLAGCLIGWLLGSWLDGDDYWGDGS